MSADSSSQSQRELVRGHFDAHARQWEELYSAPDIASRVLQERRDKVLEYIDGLQLGAGARILDLGCGAGVTARRLVERGFDVVGVDVAESMLELARKACADAGPPGRAQFQVGDAENLGFPDASFDAIVAMGLIQYLEWDRWALQCMHRALEPGGHLVVTVPNRLRLSHLADPLHLAAAAKRATLARIRRLLGRPAPRRTTYVDRNYILRRLIRTLRSLGYEVRAWHSHGFGPFRTLHRFQRLSLRLDRVLQSAADRRLLPFLAGMGSDCVIVCRKQSSVFGLDDSRGFPDPREHRRRFESERKRMLEVRDRWIAANPGHAVGRAEPLAIDSYSGKCVLVLAPHPDDEIIGCGGTLALLIRGGARALVLHATDGSDSAGVRHLPEPERRTIRIDQARVVAEAIGFAGMVVWKVPGGRLECREDLVRRLKDTLESLRPALIFVPFMTDPHRDHVAMNRILARALEGGPPAVRDARILGYEVWSLGANNAYCEITGVFRKKEELLLEYATEMKVDDYVHSCEALDYYNSYSLAGRPGFAEGFVSLGAEEYVRMVEKTLA